MRGEQSAVVFRVELFEKVDKVCHERAEFISFPLGERVVKYLVRFYLAVLDNAHE